MRRNALEWAVLISSLLAIGTVVGLLVIEAVTETRPPEPVLELRPAEARATELGWQIPATLVNRGDEAAESIVVEATATVAGEEESSELGVAFLPAGTEVEL